MPDRDWLELKTYRENNLREAKMLRRAARWHRIRSWFFTPRGAIVYFAAGYALVGLVWWGLS